MPLTRMTPLVGALEVGDRAQERGLAAAGRADEGDELAAGDLQIDVAERLHRPVARLEAQRHGLDVDRRVSRGRLGDAVSDTGMAPMPRPSAEWSLYRATPTAAVNSLYRFSARASAANGSRRMNLPRPSSACTVPSRKTTSPRDSV